MNNTHIFTKLKTSFAPGLVVFLVALPLCLGIALASGAPPIAGIISGIIGGIVVGFLSNSNISVTGPAAGLSAIILSAITDLGSFQLFLCAGIIAGVLQVILGYLRSGTIANFFPSNVIEGMLAGIGVIIIIKQIPLIFGVTTLSTLFQGNEGSILQQIHFGAVILTLISLGILLFWERNPFLKKIKMLPGALVAVAVAILINFIWIQTNSSFAISGSNLVSIPTFQNASELANILVLPDWSGFLNPAVWIIGCTIALVASIETLLCIEASDRLDPLKRNTDTNRELKAQGIGNVLSALIGGIPMTSVVVRSSANINAGGVYKTSTIIHGVFLLLAILAIPFVLNLIPLATLAAVLVLVGYKLAKPVLFVHFWKKGYTQFVPFVATFSMVVLSDLLIGVAVGLATSVAFLLFGNLKKAFKYEKRHDLDTPVFHHIKLAEEVSFLNKSAIKTRLHSLPKNSVAYIDAKQSVYIHIDIVELIEDFINAHAKEKNIEVQISGFHKKFNNETANQSIILQHRKSI
ncbi:SulP family inorganic anion transporter [Flavobacterium sp. HSC-61S13]|uniref:SulP family inorganic anion transporter n=1 Tax=Flavobacterium sp. HSC-61S13 TaxID=2910963 RepID=UPI00209C817D|nr:SulP family inorganic anion transporter [Flavobacterium sp. HSC-61S13]MCP1995407.1 MFS superfamily sulfate permease-like transporter [Flavobacterium sp. HSC-61S13]